MSAPPSPEAAAQRSRASRARLTALTGFAAGLALTVLLVLHYGAPAVGAALRAAGAEGLAAISAVHGVAIVLMGLAWWLLARHRREGAGAAGAFVWGRWVREAGAEVLPLSQIGGYVLGTRAVMLQGIGGVLAAASTVVDVTVELCAQIVYTALGLFLLLRLGAETGFATPVSIGIVVAVLGVVGFVAVQRRGASLLDRLTARLTRGWLAAIAAGAEAVQAEIRDIHRYRLTLCACFVLHLGLWIMTGAEAWLALHIMGVAIGIGPVLAIESLLYAIRSAAFVVPNAIGVQEGAYVILGAAFGIAPDIALGLSLLKRGRDLLLGAPALLLWQISESRRLWRRQGRA